MSQRQFRSDDTAKWIFGFGSGKDGAYNSAGNATFTVANASCAGTGGTTSLTLGAASTFANGDLVLIHQSRGTGVGNWELNRIIAGAGTTSITLFQNLINTYIDSGASQAQIVELKEYSSFTQNNGHTLSAPAWDGNVGGIIAFLCNKTVTIDGVLSASGKGYAGPSNFSGTAYLGYSGEGTAGGTVQSIYPNGNGGGAGTVTYTSGAGGGGGHANAGQMGQYRSGMSLGYGGDAVGNAGLTNLNFGGGGGEAVNNVAASGGGNGGGIILIITRYITINPTTGYILSSGLNGNTLPGGDSDKGSGGGAAGSVLIKCITASLGTDRAICSGGVGVGSYAKGGDGSVGRLHLDYLLSKSGTTTPTLDVTRDYYLGVTNGMAMSAIF
jgi:large repetitive protein